MDAITNALKTLNNSGNNIKKEFFHEESFIYMKTNEMIQEYVQYLLHKKNILSVIGSGDQIINSLITKPEYIDCFDISIYPEYFLNLKLAAIKTLSKEEYLNLFFECALTSKDEYYDDLYFEKIRNELVDKYRDFWDALFNHTDWYEITNSSLFSSEVVSKEYAIKQNLYLNDNIYYHLKNNISSVKFNFFTCNILDSFSEFNKKYDLVFLSNISAYVNKEKYRQMLKQFKLSKDGYIITYLFGKLEENEKFFKNPKVKIKKFNDSDNGIMLHRN